MKDGCDRLHGLSGVKNVQVVVLKLEWDPLHPSAFSPISILSFFVRGLSHSRSAPSPSSPPS